MPTSRLTISLPESEIDYIKTYAKKNRISVSQLVDRWIKSLKAAPKEKTALHPDIKKFTGIIPRSIEADEVYADYVMDKHQ